MRVHDDGSGEALFAGGEFAHAGQLVVDHVARWDGASWSALGGGTDDQVLALESFDDGAGTALFAGGKFANAGGVAARGIARWDGAQWAAVGALDAQVDIYALRAFDDGAGPALYAGGSFTSIGGTSAQNVARWNGVTWSALDAGLPNQVRALAVFDDGGGPALYAAGGNDTFQPSGLLRRWNGSTWIAVGGSIDDVVLALQPFDDGGGPALFVGGEFLTAGGVTVDHFARWNGSTWSAVLATPLPRRVRALAVYDEGQGPHLYVGGQDQTINGAALLGRLEGAQLVPLREPAVSGQVTSFAEFDDGRATRPALYTGGSFQHVGAFRSEAIARWADGTVVPPQSYCTAGTTSNGCVATISSSGEASRNRSSGFDVNVTGVDGQRLGIVFFGFAPTATHWGAGSSYVCVAPPTIRASTQTSGGTSGACDGAFALDFNAWMFAHPAQAPSPGADTYMQAWFRDPPSAKATSLSDALHFQVVP